MSFMLWEIDGCLLKITHIVFCIQIGKRCKKILDQLIAHPVLHDVEYIDDVGRSKSRPN